MTVHSYRNAFFVKQQFCIQVLLFSKFCYFWFDWEPDFFNPEWVINRTEYSNFNQINFSQCFKLPNKSLFLLSQVFTCLLNVKKDFSHSPKVDFLQRERERERERGVTAGLRVSFSTALCDNLFLCEDIYPDWSFSLLVMLFQDWQQQSHPSLT